jgi:hypothetical protein
MMNNSNKLTEMGFDSLEGIQEILTLPQPAGSWKADQWKRVCRDEFQSRIVAMWAVNELIQDIGWIEHTNDWDWWMHLKFADGTTRKFDCGTYFAGVTDSEEKRHNSPKDVQEWWKFDGTWEIRTLHITAVRFEDDEKFEGYHDEEVDVDIWTLDGIKVGYDT